MCTHSSLKHACSFLPFFCCIFCHFEAFSDWKRKNRCHHIGRPWCDTTFLFVHFFFFQSGSTQSWMIWVQKCSKYHFSTLLDKIYNLGKKIENLKIKTKKGMEDWARGPQWWAQPTTDLLNSADFGWSEENQSWSGGYPELIYSVCGMHVLAWAFADPGCFVTCPHSGVLKAARHSVRCPTQGLEF